MATSSWFEVSGVGTKRYELFMHAKKEMFLCDCADAETLRLCCSHIQKEGFLIMTNAKVFDAFLESGNI